MIASVFDAIFGWIPEVTTLPFGIDAFVTQSVGQFYAFAVVWWPIQPLISCLLFYLVFSGLMLLLKFLIGSRIPDISTN